MKEYKTLQEVNHLVTDYLIHENHIDRFGKYEIEKLPARKLLRSDRFDLMAKWIYIAAKEKKLDFDFGKRIYYDNINAFSCGTFSEPGMKNKTSFEAYIKDFDVLIERMKVKGFDDSQSLIPLGKNDDLLDGSHRVATAAYFDQDVAVIRFPQVQRKYVYDYHYFAKYRMSDESMGYMAAQYATITKRCYMACLWPKADLSQTGQVENLLKKAGNIIYSQDVYLTFSGLCNLMVQIYGHQAWIGSIENHFSGIRGKAEACYRAGQPIRTWLFEAENLEAVVEAKRKIRDIFQLGNHSIHISDNAEETKTMTRLLYHRNSVQFLNRSMPYRYSQVYLFLKDLKCRIQEMKQDEGKWILGTDAVMEVCGLRNADTITALPDLLHNPKDYFYFEGMKFITPQKVLEMKQTSSNKKDLRDTVMLKKYMKQNLHIPKEYQFGTIDKIYLYQITHGIYGQGAFSYAQYKEHIRKQLLSRYKVTKLVHILQMRSATNKSGLKDKKWNTEREEQQ